MLGSTQPGTKCESKNQSVVTDACEVLKVQGQENTVISQLLSSHKQENTFPWDSAKGYFWQGRALSNRNVIQVPATKMIRVAACWPQFVWRGLCTISGKCSAHSKSSYCCVSLMLPLFEGNLFSAEVTTAVTVLLSQALCSHGGISKHRSKPLLRGGGLSGRVLLCERLNNERNTSGFPPQWESAFLFLSTLQKQVVCFAFSQSCVVFGTVVFLLPVRPKKKKKEKWIGENKRWI